LPGMIYAQGVQWATPLSIAGNDHRVHAPCRINAIRIDASAQEAQHLSRKCAHGVCKSKANARATTALPNEHMAHLTYTGAALLRTSDQQYCVDSAGADRKYPYERQ